MFRSNLQIKSAVLVFSFLLSILIYFWTNRLTDIYGIVSIVYLILVMLAGPLYRLYPEFPFKSFYRSSLGGLGISTFYFAFLHSYIGFFRVLHGFNGLSFLSNNYLLSLIFGLIALLILALMAGTSFTWAMKALGKKWKTLHRFIYLAGIGIILHTIMVGSDFYDFTKPVAAFIILGFTILMLFETKTAYNYLVGRFPEISDRLLRLILSIIFIGSYYLLFILHQSIIGGHIH
jgi:DMSO/TMAO reductase YedYZ heme-binding membrane subunit